MPELKTTTEVEKLFQHSEEFIQKVYSYENGIHAAVGYGIANSYLIEGSGLNIIMMLPIVSFRLKKSMQSSAQLIVIQ